MVPGSCKAAFLSEDEEFLCHDLGNGISDLLNQAVPTVSGTPGCGWVMA